MNRSTIVCISAVALSACSDPILCAGEGASDGVVTSALQNGSPEAHYVALDAWEMGAVVLVESLTAGVRQPVDCTGTLVAPGRVLTAAHCLPAPDAEGPQVQVAFLDPTTNVTSTSTSTSWTRHPTLDLSIIQFANVPAAAAGTIPVATAVPRTLGEGSLVQLAGLGRDETSAIGHRRFLVAGVTLVAPEELTITSGGLGGACNGDSGGPALIRGGDGEVVVAAVLTRGTASCFGDDVYLRLDSPAARSWLSAELGAIERVRPAVAPHTALRKQGRCFGELAVWAEDGALQVRNCGGSVCGWDPKQGGFRCVERDTDPCQGVSDIGACAGDTAVRCIGGDLSSSPCGACGWRCGRSPQTGKVGCYAK